MAHADRAPAKLPGKPPRPIVAQAAGAGARAPDRALAAEGGHGPSAGKLVEEEGSPLVAGEEHRLEALAGEAGGEADAGEALGGEAKRIGAGAVEPLPLPDDPHRPQGIPGGKAEAMRVAQRVAREALTIKGCQPQRQRPHAARSPSWRPAATSAA
jgi:hypothetical protein